MMSQSRVGKVDHVEPHRDTWVEIENLGSVSRPYLRNYTGGERFIDPFHRSLSQAPKNGINIDLGIEGWLRVADALKLYELAYFCPSDVLEFGTNRGLSTFVMAAALGTAEPQRRLVTVERNERYVEMARENLASRGLGATIEFLAADADDVGRAMITFGRRFGLCFVDHSHAYEAVASTCGQLPDLLEAGGFVVFHDFNDSRNSRRHDIGDSPNEYGVYAAVEDHLDRRHFSFFGVYGCCGVFRRH
jgi:predicted O-methyltransferase YrrM